MLTFLESKGERRLALRYSIYILFLSPSLHRVLLSSLCLTLPNSEIFHYTSSASGKKPSRFLPFVEVGKKSWSSPLSKLAFNQTSVPALFFFTTKRTWCCQVWALWRSMMWIWLHLGFPTVFYSFAKSVISLPLLSASKIFFSYSHCLFGFMLFKKKKKHMFLILFWGRNGGKYSCSIYHL